MMRTFSARTLFTVFLLFVSLKAFAVEKKLTEKDVRRIVTEVLQEKDKEIAQLKQKIQQLEHPPQPLISQAPPIITTATPVEPAATEPAPSTDSAFNNLKWSGFFNLNAQTDAKSRANFDFQALELHLEYLYNEHFAANAALVWDSSEGANIGTGVIDYHWFDDRVPPRGRIFQNQGFHIQAGRFDLPFGIDYQYFAAPDRINITAPFSTERIQQGGFKENGFRSYGSWDIWNYAAYWTNSVYDSAGTAAGGRLGMILGKRHYQMHYRDKQNNIELGASMLADMRHGEVRNYVYGTDLNVHYGIWQLAAEALWRTGGEQNENSYYTTLSVNLQDWLQQSVILLARYEAWQPNRSQSFVKTIPRFTVGLNYHLNDYLYIKLEYLNTLGKMPEVANFETNAAKAQLVVNF
jgi:hypothetical protein